VRFLPNFLGLWRLDDAFVCVWVQKLSTSALIRYLAPLQNAGLEIMVKFGVSRPHRGNMMH